MKCVPASLIKRALNANMSPSSLTVALRLILVTPTGSNSVTLTKAEFMVLADDTNWDTARSKLTSIRKEKLAHVTTNDHVYVSWLDATGGLHEPFPRLEIQSPTRENSSTDAWKSNHPRVKTQAPQPGDNSTRVEIQSPARENSRAGDWISNQIDALVVSHNNNNSTEQVERSIKLLVAAGMPVAEATKRAGQNQYEWLERQTFAYWRDLQAKKVFHWKALCSRIDRKFRADSLTDEDRQSALWIALYGRAETEEQREQRESEERRRTYIPDEFEHIIRG